MDEIYDEFGNYIGPDLEDEEIKDYEDEEDISIEPDNVPNEQVKTVAIVPHEEKVYYSSAADVFGVETLVEEEDAQPITEPIIAPVTTKCFDLLERELPKTTFSFNYMNELMKVPSRVRHVCFVGSLHSGKTSLVDLFVEETHSPSNATYGGMSQRHRTGRRDTEYQRVEEDEEIEKPEFLPSTCSFYLKKYTDSKREERERQISIRSSPISFVLSTSKSAETTPQHYVINIVDTPGHINFLDDALASMRLCDGCILIIDAIEGLNDTVMRQIRVAVLEDMSICLVVNGLDRLIIELRLPPTDCYHKLRHTIESVSDYIEEVSTKLGKPSKSLHPVDGNVCFASARYGFIFTISSFAEFYFNLWELRVVDHESLDTRKLTEALWGDVFYDAHPEDTEGPNTPRFSDSSKSTSGTLPRAFVALVLEPLYKIFGFVASEEKDELKIILEEIGIHLNSSVYTLEPTRLLKVVFQQFFVNTSSFVDMVVRHVPDVQRGGAIKVANHYAGHRKSRLYENMVNCKVDQARLVIYTAKNYARPSGDKFDCFGRVLSGYAKVGTNVKVLGESYALDDDEDCVNSQITDLWTYQTRYRIALNAVPAGNLVLIGGIDDAVVKTSTVIEPCQDYIRRLESEGHVADEEDLEECEIMKPLQQLHPPVIRVGCEPLNPTELPKMIQGLRRIEKAYPAAKTVSEESGEYVIVGTGELFLDCVFSDLRKFYSDVEVKVADPVVQFCETVSETSALKCLGESANKFNKLYMIAEPLEKGIAEAVENKMVSIENDVIKKYLVENYDWDELTASNIWAFGPDIRGGSVLVDDCLIDDDQKESLFNIKNSIIQGFRWATREGPLIEETIRNVKFKLIDAEISADPITRGGGQIIPATRRVAYSSFLLATPRLMEPIFFAEITCPPDCVASVYTVLARRRGHVAKEIPAQGSPLFVIHAYLPAIDSFGFETDLRTYTSGQAFVLTTFDYWAVVPGDPLDKSITLRPIEPAPAPHLGRDFLIKTRRRKGLSEDVTIQRFFDEEMLTRIAQDLQNDI